MRARGSVEKMNSGGYQTCVAFERKFSTLFRSAVIANLLLCLSVTRIEAIEVWGRGVCALLLSLCLKE